MQGKEAFKLIAKVIDQFIQTLMSKADLSLQQIDWVVPHQASKLAIEHLTKRLAIEPNKVVNLLATRGNQIAASIPSALHELFKQQQVQPAKNIADWHIGGLESGWRIFGGMMKAIVTGATGFLGGHLTSMLVAQGWQVLAMGRNRQIGASLVSASVNFKQVDITCLSQVDEAFETVDVVFHCAALSDVWGSYRAFYEVNVLGSEHILACCKKYHVKKLVHVSTTSVYFDFKTNKTS